MNFRPGTPEECAVVTAVILEGHHYHDLWNETEDFGKLLRERINTELGQCWFVPYRTDLFVVRATADLDGRHMWIRLRF